MNCKQPTKFEKNMSRRKIVIFIVLFLFLGVIALYLLLPPQINVTLCFDNSWNSGNVVVDGNVHYKIPNDGLLTLELRKGSHTIEAIRYDGLRTSIHLNYNGERSEDYIYVTGSKMEQQ